MVKITSLLKLIKIAGFVRGGCMWNGCEVGVVPDQCGIIIVCNCSKGLRAK
jgi:hypothetical protein